LGGDAETVTERVRSGLGDEGDLPDLGHAVRVAVDALAGPDRRLTASELEVALLDRDANRRCFRRLDEAAITDILAATSPVSPAVGETSANRAAEADHADLDAPDEPEDADEADPRGDT